MKKKIILTSFILTVLVLTSTAVIADAGIPFRNFETEKSIPTNFTAGETITGEFYFENMADRNQTFITKIKISSTGETPEVWQGDFRAEVELNTSTEFREDKTAEYSLDCWEDDNVEQNGTFWCHGEDLGDRIILPKSDNNVKVSIMSHPALVPGTYNHYVDFMVVNEYLKITPEHPVVTRGNSQNFEAYIVEVMEEEERIVEDVTDKVDWSILNDNANSVLEENRVTPGRSGTVDIEARYLYDQDYDTPLKDIVTLESEGRTINIGPPADTPAEPPENDSEIEEDVNGEETEDIDEPEFDIRITGLEVETESDEAPSEGVITVILENFGETSGEETFTISVELDGEEIETFTRQVEVEGGGTETITIIDTFLRPGDYVVSVGEEQESLTLVVPESPEPADPPVDAPGPAGLIVENPAPFGTIVAAVLLLGGLLIYRFRKKKKD